MAKLSASSIEQQVLKAAKALHVSDFTGLRGDPGLLVPAVAAWVRNGSEWAQVWPLPPSAPTLTVSVVSDWRLLALTWSAPGATSYIVKANGATVYTGTGTSLSFEWFDDYSLTPGAAVSFEVTAVNAVGSSTGSFGAVTPALPVPVFNTSACVATDAGVSLSWSACPNAESYRVKARDVSTWGLYMTVGSTSGTTLVVDQDLGSTETYYVEAVYRNASGVESSSAMSAPVSVTRPKATAPVGVYEFLPSQNAVHMAGEAGGSSPSWSTSRAMLFHGDSGAGDTYGVQTSAFWYGAALRTTFPGGDLGGSSVTRCQVWVRRAAGYGASNSFASRFQLHPHSGVPSATTLGPGLSDYVEAGALGLGQGAWIDLPTSWGVLLLAGTYKGVTWGNIAGRYMAADKSLLQSPDGPPVGTLRITVG